MIAVVAGALVSLGGPATGTAVADTEAVAPPGCSVGYLCVWSGPNFTGLPGRIAERTSIPNWSALSGPDCPAGDWSSCARSFYNNAVVCTADLWSAPNYSGTRLSLSRGTGITNPPTAPRVFSNSWRC
ncbi:Peptidase inhibitor family I36 [Streptomyces sp. cf124]|uniref:peptidase inhibitor family I36 protein n=1 Tax=unclassified Streptomyces TaxID=2593676 RepID=UPI0008EE04E2|nr:MULTISPECIES: peptidase inhibitor family I36 protein [unclassified Streptomyces]SFO11089.1 Peptidase inhibitor family I36 [Streptomyces sp. cf124]